MFSPIKLVSFAVQKLLNVIIRPHLLVFAFVFFALGDRAKTHSHYFCQSVPFSSSFMVSDLTFRLFNPFCLFLYMVRENVPISFLYR